MGRCCSVCTSPARRRIDRALLEGASLAGCARRYGVTPDALGRHFKTHLQGALQKYALAEREMVHRGARLQDQLNYIADKAQSILEAAEAAGNLNTALKALAELRQAAQLAAVAAGELSDGKIQVNVQVNQEHVDELVDQNTQIRIAVCYLQRHAPHLLMGAISEPSVNPDSRCLPQRTIPLQAECVTETVIMEED